MQIGHTFKFEAIVEGISSNSRHIPFVMPSILNSYATIVVQILSPTFEKPPSFLNGFHIYIVYYPTLKLVDHMKQLPTKIPQNFPKTFVLAQLDATIPNKFSKASMEAKTGPFPQ